MADIKLDIQDNIFLRIERNFDLTQFVDGDIKVVLHLNQSEILLNETQFIYFVDQFITILNSVLEKNEKSIYIGSQDIAYEYIEFLKGSSKETNIEWKTFIDCQVMNAVGYAGFIYCSSNNFYIQISKLDATLLELKKESSNYLFNNPQKLLLTSVSEDILQNWLLQLKKLRNI